MHDIGNNNLFMTISGHSKSTCLDIDLSRLCCFKTFHECYNSVHRERLSHFKHEFRQETKNIIKSLNKGLDKMVAYPIQERYDEMVNKGITILNNEIHKVLLVLETLLARIDNSLTSYRNRMLQAQEKTTGKNNNLAGSTDCLVGGFIYTFIYIVVEW